MQERTTLRVDQIDRDLLRFVFHTPRWFWAAAGALSLVVVAALVAEVLVIARGMQLLGYTNVVYWALPIVNFTFWVGISHAGVMVAAVLRLTRAEWRRPITRTAEVLALASAAVAGLFAIVHTGRPWRTLYWMLPYDFTREIWPSPRSPLIWDPNAFIAHILGTLLFVYFDLIPDMAAARDRTRGWRRALYDAASLGFRGTNRQWRLQRAASRLISALILPVFVVIAYDLPISLLPGWHQTAMAPYLVVGGLYAGMAAVVIALVLLRSALGLREYVQPDHFDVLGRLLIVFGLGYLYFFLMSLYFGLFSREPVELRIWLLRLTVPPTSWLFYLQVITTLAVPLPLLLLRRARRSLPLMLVASVSVVIGVFLDRYILLVTPLSFKYPFVFTWIETYEPSLVEYVFTAAALALVMLGVLVFAKLVPIIPLWNVKEGQIRLQRLRIGQTEIPGVVRE